MWIIIDWTGRHLEVHGSFETFEDAEYYLSEFLGDDYETDRCEYFAVKRSEVKQ